MRITLLSSILAVLGVACGEDGPRAGATPEETFETFRAALRDREFEVLWDLMPAARRASASERWESVRTDPAALSSLADQLGLSVREVEGMSARDSFVAQFEALRAGPDGPPRLEFVRAEVQGDRAEVVYLTGVREQVMQLVREDGRWCIAEDGVERAPRAGGLAPETAAATPEAAFERLRTAMAAADWESLWGQFAPARRQRFGKYHLEGAEEIAEKHGFNLSEVRRTTTRDLFVAILEVTAAVGPEERARIAGAEFLGEKIDGDRATVRIRVEGREERLRFVKADGVWYVDESFF